MHVIRDLTPSKNNGILENKQVKYYLSNYTDSLLGGYKHSIEDLNTSVVIIVDGRSGDGKSTLAFQFARALDKNFGLHKVHFVPRTFLKGDSTKIGLNHCKKGDCIVFDESMIVNSRNSMSQVNKAIMIAMSMIRSKRVYVIFCVNSIFDLDKNLALHRCDCLFHVYTKNGVRGRYMAFYQAVDGRNRIKDLYILGKKYYNYTRPAANFHDRFQKEFIIDNQVYEKQKQTYIESYLSGNETVKHEKYKIKQNSIIALYKKGLPVEEISTSLSIPVPTVYKHIERYKSQLLSIENSVKKEDVPQILSLSPANII